MKMKKVFPPVVWGVVLFGCIVIFPLASCNFFGLPEYELTVTLGDGVQGTPASGRHAYEDLTVVDYKYTALNPLHSVEAFWEGTRMAAEGKITMYKNTTVTANLIDIRGASWSVEFNYEDTTIATINFKITFSGNDILAGTFSDTSTNPVRNYKGTWDASKGSINLVYSDWKDYKLTGDLFKMSGTWEGESKKGTWSATR